MYGDIDAELVPETKAIESKYLDIEREIREIERGLSEPSRSLNLIYAISHLIGDQSFSLVDILPEILSLIPDAWQYPEITCARIALDMDREFKTTNFRETLWKQTSDIIVYDEQIGTLEVGYLEEMPQRDEGPFLEDERYLLNHLSRVIGMIVFYKRAEKLLDLYCAYLEEIGQQNQPTMQELEEFLVRDLLARERYEMVLSSSMTGLWDWNLNTNEIYFSPGWKALVGCLEGELENSPDEWFNRVHPEDIDRVRSSLKAHLEGLTQHYEEDFRMLHDDGTYRWALCRGIALHNADHDPYRMGGIIVDIGDRKRIEDELDEARAEIMEQNRRLNYVLDSIGDPIAMFGVDGKALHINKNYEELLGLTKDELEAMSADELWQSMSGLLRDPNRFRRIVKPFLTKQEGEIQHIVEIVNPERKTFYHSMKFTNDEEEKPYAVISIYRDISNEIEIDRMKGEISRLRAQLEKRHSFKKIIGRSKQMREIYRLIERAANSNITILIQGESGTGKELIAEAIHFNSKRKNGPLIPVNCAAIPDTLIESELFGHERGAFTGASSRRIGRFEQANGGAIILDEIGAMSSSNQAALLRVLQDGEIQRVGGTKSIPVDVRVIAITNKDLEAAMKAGVFREDLYYRISAFPITLPPLKERSEDIPLLAEHFLNRYAKDAGKEISFFSDEAMQCLMRYHWPGNVRELENGVNRAVLLETSNVLRAKSLPKYIQSAGGGTGPNALTFGDVKADELPTLEEVEKRLLRHALKVTRGNISQVARALDIGRVTVYRKLERYNLMKAD